MENALAYEDLFDWRKNEKAMKKLRGISFALDSVITDGNVRYDMIYDRVGKAFKENGKLSRCAPMIINRLLTICGEEMKNWPRETYGDTVEKQACFMNAPYLTTRTLANLIINGIRYGSENAKRIYMAVYKTFYPEGYGVYKRLKMLEMRQGEEIEQTAFIMAAMAAIAEGKPFGPNTQMFLCTVDMGIWDGEDVIQKDPLKGASSAEPKEHETEEASDWAKDTVREINRPGSAERECFKKTVKLMKILHGKKYRRLMRLFLGVFENDAEYTMNCLDDAKRAYAATYGKDAEDLSGILLITEAKMLTDFAGQMYRHVEDSLNGITGLDPADGPSFPADGGRIEKLDRLLSQSGTGENGKGTEPGNREEGSKKAKGLIKNLTAERERELERLGDELEKARAEKREKEEKLASLKEKYDALKTENERLKKETNRAEEERFELSRLREYVHSLSREDTGPPEAFDMKKEAAFIRERKVIIIGGHENWINKLKKDFPLWVYTGNNAFADRYKAVMDGADMIYFFTDHVSHKAFCKYMAHIREKGLRCGFIHTVNVETNIRQIGGDLRRNAG